MKGYTHDEDDDGSPAADCVEVAVAASSASLAAEAFQAVAVEIPKSMDVMENFKFMKARREACKSSDNGNKLDL